MIPQTFEQWKKCIMADCHINLSKAFAQGRLAIYEDKDNRETRKFISLYGEQHLQNIINWFKQI